MDKENNNFEYIKINELTDIYTVNNEDFTDHFSDSVSKERFDKMFD